MPRRAKPPRLLLRQRKDREPVYVILDSGRERSTGFGPSSREAAEKCLADYISEKWEAPKQAATDAVTIADVLTAYATEHAPTTAAPQRVGYAIDALMGFWQGKTVSEITGNSCRAYASHRNRSDGTIRRELTVLRAALKHCVREGYLQYSPEVTLPSPPPPTDRWLTRNEVAALIRAARRSQRSRHIAKFILVAVYTGTRKSAILNLEWQPTADAGHIDVERGVMYRSGSGERQTKKRRTPVRMPRQLCLQARLWRKNSARYVVEYQGKKVRDIKTAWAALCREAGIEGATRHTLKHTAITWAMQNGADPTHAAGYFATSLETIQRVYLHHHPDFQKSAVRAMENKPRP